jgi:hypothetical protein
VKVILDENLSPALARALGALFEGQHQVEHIRTKFGPGAQDVDWIKALSQEGRWIVISGDRRITKVKAEAQAFRSSKLIGFFLSPGLKKSKVTKQMQRILALWDGIEDISSRLGGGAMFELPVSGAIRQI